MPIRYTPTPEFEMPNLNFMGAYAQGRALRMNQLREQVLENELAQQEAMRGVITQPGFDISSPQAVQSLLGAGAFEPALKLREAQDISSVRASQRENYLNEVLLRSKKFDAELPNIRAMTRKNLAEADKETLSLFSAKTNVAQDLISRLDPEGLDWPQRREELMQLDPTLQPPENFDPKWNDRALRTAKTMQEVATDIMKKSGEARIPKVIAPTAEMPGMVVSPQGVQKLPEIRGQTAFDAEPPAPVVRRPAAMQGRLETDFQLPPEVMALQKRMAEEEQVKRVAPLGREREALGAYRFSNTLKGIGNTFVELAQQRGVTVPGETEAETFQTLANRSRLGEVFGKLNASERLAIVDSLRSQVATAIPQFAAAAGLQSKNFDSDAEGKRIQAALADPDNIANISSAFRILNDLNKQFGTGSKLFEGKKEEEKILKQRRGVAGEVAGPATNRPSLDEIFR